MSSAKQIKPNHADHISGYKEKYLQKMFNDESVIAQPKYDGERMLIHIDHGNIYCTSRRLSKKTMQFMENQDKLPILYDYIDTNVDYTVIDCECYAKDWSTVVGILHSLPERAIELQKIDTVKFACFDCLYFNGEDCRDLSYRQRLLRLISFFKFRVNHNQNNMHIAAFMNEQGQISNTFHLTKIMSTEMAMQFMQNSINAGFEGIVVKSLDRAYYDEGASLKCKKFETVDVVVCGYDIGRGKYADTIGALHVGYYDAESDSVVKISNVNCSTDKERNMWRDNWDAMKYSVIEIKCQEVTDKSFRHPVYLRVREDKDYKMCTKDTIFK